MGGEVVVARRPMPVSPGRPKGSVNRFTRDVRSIIAIIAERNVAKLERWIIRVARDDPAKAADLMLRMFEYHLPKLRAVEHTGHLGAGSSAPKELSNDPVEAMRAYMDMMGPGATVTLEHAKITVSAALETAAQEPPDANSC